MVRAWLRECGSAWGTGAVLALVALYWVGPWIETVVAPVSSYYDLTTVEVRDTVEGVSPGVVIRRSILAERFEGSREVEILQVQGATFVAWGACGPHVVGPRWYRRGEALPEGLDLDTWMGIPPHRECPLPPGEYMVATTIRVRGVFGWLSHTVDSNSFVVRPAA